MSADQVAELPLPKVGEDVNLLVSHGHRLRGRITDDRALLLAVELEQQPIRTPFRLRSGSAVQLEWVHRQGLMRLPTRVEASRSEPTPVIELTVDGAPELAERRTQERVRITLEAAAWSLLDPTRLVAGKTVDLSATGALLHLPGLSPFAAMAEIRIDLPDRPFMTRARVVRRHEPDLVAVVFHATNLDDQARFADFVRKTAACLPQQGRASTRRGWALRRRSA
jgi:hypothetical protein